MLEEKTISLNASGGSGDLFVDNNGNPVQVNTIQDDEGRYVLRIVDSAPFGYNEDHNAIQQMQVGELPRFEFVSFSPQFGVNVNAGESFIHTLQEDVMSKYNKLSIAIVADTEHTFRMNYQWRSTRGANSSVVGVDTNVITATETRARDLVEDFVTDNLQIDIRNNDSVAHTYDVYVYGIRG